jgi:hypothetical protein
MVGQLEAAATAGAVEHTAGTDGDESDAASQDGLTAGDRQASARASATAGAGHGGRCAGVDQDVSRVVRRVVVIEVGKPAGRVMCGYAAAGVGTPLDDIAR